jgi:CCR4-NOT transcriptional regulation complex NOT5 subunit
MPVDLQKAPVRPLLNGNNLIMRPIDSQLNFHSREIIRIIKDEELFAVEYKYKGKWRNQLGVKKQTTFCWIFPDAYYTQFLKLNSIIFT